ncbi:Zinc-type alcohol dehydrogenase-like protein SE_1777 [Eumeta japonica]|uniref:Zinc-type alcohol dehydrogenase-like protein SE_1777 n=1 Tax=Eumeta variegata TaxID=151549 RepID=A0A4C1VIJ6_EUMVA|nr:Zinc-type alcohol dehydrogenase-like protein SE_1777 [Eumeta japonica]
MMSKRLPKVMKAVGLYKYLPIADPNSLQDLQVKVPDVGKTDVLVEVKAVAVNPIDTKQRAPKPIVETVPRILGWDGAGVIVSKGEQAKLFEIGEEVYFTGNIGRSGANAEYVAIDQELVGRKPKTFSFEQAAAMPLTLVTAYESIVDRLLISEKDNGKSLLIINSAGGVGSIASQIGKNFGLFIIGTASRTETVNWSKEYGANIVLDHSKDLLAQLEESGFKSGVDYILVNFDPYPYWDTMMKAIKPQGKICILVDSSGLVDIKPLKDKSVTLVSEMMATRIKYNTEDKIRSHLFLEEASKLFDAGKLKCTLTKTLSPINAANLREAHRLIEEKHVIGKIVLSGF